MRVKSVDMHNHVTETRGVIPLFSQILRATLLALVAATSMADEAALDPVRDFMLLANAEEHVIGQNMVLEKIGKEHPDLLPEVQRAMAALQSDKLRPSLENIPRLLELGLPKASETAAGWLAKRPERMAQMRAYLASGPFSREKALELLLEMSRRGNGEFKTPLVADAILAANPLYRNKPMAEINAGYWEWISSQGHAKGKGRNVVLWVPRTWQIKEAKGPNIIKTAVSNMGFGPVSVMLMVRNQETDENGNARFLTAAEYDQMLMITDKIPGPDGYSLLSTTKDHVGGRWWIRQTAESIPGSQAGGNFFRIENFQLYHNRHVIAVFFTFICRDKSEADALAAYHEKTMRDMVAMARIEDESTYPQFSDKGLSSIDPELGMRWGLAAAMYAMLTPLTTTFWSLFAPFAGIMKNPGVIYAVLQLALIGGYPFMLWSYFHQNRVSGWRSMVPILSALELCKLTGLRKRWLLLLLLPYAGSWIVHGILSSRLSRRHGRSWMMTLSLIFLPCLGMMLLGRHKSITGVTSLPPSSGEAGPKSASRPLN